MGHENHYRHPACYERITSPTDSELLSFYHYAACNPYTEGSLELKNVLKPVIVTGQKQDYCSIMSRKKSIAWFSDPEHLEVELLRTDIPFMGITDFLRNRHDKCVIVPYTLTLTAAHVIHIERNPSEVVEMLQYVLLSEDTNDHQLIQPSNY